MLRMYGMHQPKVLTSARLKYISINRTFNCKRAVEQLGYKPIVSLKVNSNYFDTYSIFFSKEHW